MPIDVQPGKPSAPARALDRLVAAASLKPIRRCVILNNGDEFEFWATPLTAAERLRITKETKDGDEFAMALMIQKATDAGGNLLFAPGDRATLQRQVRDSDLQKIQLAIMKEDELIDPKP